MRLPLLRKGDWARNMASWFRTEARCLRCPHEAALYYLTVVTVKEVNFIFAID